jgi:outer membrane receptor for ferric coprogen and ferric-rhodotorulic acid
VFGASTAESNGKEYENFSATSLTIRPWDWGGQQVAEPTYPGAYLAADSKRSPEPRLRGRAPEPHRSPEGRGRLQRHRPEVDRRVLRRRSSRVRNLSQPLCRRDLRPDAERLALRQLYRHLQSAVEVDIDHLRSHPAKGKSYEAGVKSEWFGKRLYATAAVFKSEQKNLAEYAGSFPDGKSYYAGVDTEVTGYELEVSGAITDQWTVSGGWTSLSVEDEADGNDVRTYPAAQDPEAVDHL